MSTPASPSSNTPVTKELLARRTLNRRRFIYFSSVAASGLALSQPAMAAVKLKSPNEKLDIAIIGSGGRGAANTKDVKSENIVALCDVDEEALSKAASQYPKARKFVDFRKLFDDAANEFDAVVVSTTEHTHAFATMRAIHLRKHIYCEKPLTHSVWEARQITEAAKKADIVTQMGIQIHSTNNYRRVVELVQSGAIGKVSEVHVWVSRAWGDGGRPEGTPPVPSNLHWDLWLGPAPERPYHPDYVIGKPKWYKFWDFGGGTMSDLGAHWLDLPFWALKLQAPLTVQAFGPKANPETAPASMHVTYEYGSRGDLPPVKVHWYQGEQKPALLQDGKIPQWDSGHLFLGEKGMLLTDYGKHLLLPEDKFKDFKPPQPFLKFTLDHHAEWIQACKGNGETSAPFSYAGPLTEANHLGNVAHRVGKKIQWDAATMTVKNAPEAAKLIRREYRKGWTLV